MAKKGWTNSELVYLQENYGKSTVPELAVFLDRSNKSVKRKIEDLGLLKGTNIEWGDGEIDILLEEKTVGAIMEKLPNRSVSAIYHKRREVMVG